MALAAFQLSFRKPDGRGRYPCPDCLSIPTRVLLSWIPWPYLGEYHGDMGWFALPWKGRHAGIDCRPVRGRAAQNGKFQQSHREWASLFSNSSARSWIVFFSKRALSCSLMDLYSVCMGQGFFSEHCFRPSTHFSRVLSSSIASRMARTGSSLDLAVI